MVRGVNHNRACRARLVAACHTHLRSHDVQNGKVIGDVKAMVTPQPAPGHKFVHQITCHTPMQPATQKLDNTGTCAVLGHRAHPPHSTHAQHTCSQQQSLLLHHEQGWRRCSSPLLFPGLLRVAPEGGLQCHHHPHQGAQICTNMHAQTCGEHVCMSRCIAQPAATFCFFFGPSPKQSQSLVTRRYATDHVVSPELHHNFGRHGGTSRNWVHRCEDEKEGRVRTTEPTRTPTRSHATQQQQQQTATAGVHVCAHTVST